MSEKSEDLVKLLDQALVWDVVKKIENLAKDQDPQNQESAKGFLTMMAAQRLFHLALEKEIGKRIHNKDAFHDYLNEIFHNMRTDFEALYEMARPS